MMVPATRHGVGDGGGGDDGQGGTREETNGRVKRDTFHTGNAFSSGAGRGGSGDTGSQPISYYVLGASRNRNANYFSRGGGSRHIIPDTVLFFRGREAGGGLRSEVLGTRSYGSGYPYIQQDAQKYGVVGQPFPFGFWPLYWYGHGRSDEYGGSTGLEGKRPGGDEVLVQLTPDPTSNWGNSVLGTNGTLWMIGDRASVTTLHRLLVDPKENYTYGCSLQHLGIYGFQSRNPQPIQFDNVIQWYRSSSFALAYDGYNNTSAHSPFNKTAGLGWNDSTPLPALLVSSPFLQCINTTILAALPIIDSEDLSSSLTKGQIAGIVLASIAVLVICCRCAYAIRKDRRAKRSASREVNGERIPLAVTDLQEPGVQELHSSTTPEIAPGVEPIFRFPDPLRPGDEKPPNQ